MSEVLIALAGNQNCGKTTLFNRLTGSNQHVGNFPGVTVEKKMGIIKNFKEATLVDLPGIYSLSPYTSEEVVTRDFILKDHPALIVNIVDATNIERNLYLSLQLMELKTPMVIALNMMDEVTASGNSIDVEKLSKHLQIPIVPISASKNEGINDLISVIKKPFIWIFVKVKYIVPFIQLHISLKIMRRLQIIQHALRLPNWLKVMNRCSVLCTYIKMIWIL